MTSNMDYVWNPNAIDKSCLSMEEHKNSKKNFCVRWRWPILILILITIPAAIVATYFVIHAKHSAQSSVLNTLNASASSAEHNISIKGLFTIKTAAQANICSINETIEDCVLIYNAKIIMNALILIPTPTSNSSNSSISLTFPENSTTNNIDCKALKIRRSQLTEIFETRTLKTIYNLSGILYTSANSSTESNSSTKPQSRSQIDGRALKNRWTSPINYYISTTTGFTSAMIANIYTAISNWANNTCLVFNELSAITSTTNKSYIFFQRDDQYGCSSAVGYDPTDPTLSILISASCSVILVSIMHEIGHSLGYIHTQSRVDRNTYVSIASDNIQQDYAGNFFMWSFGTLEFGDVSFPYDFGSFMHYDSYAFSKNNLPTIIPYDTRYGKTMGQRERAAFYDYKQINRLYCTRSDCPQMFNYNSCQNNGYLDPKTCSRCICPEGFSGTYCDQRDSNSNCGDTIINSTPYSATQITIQNPSPTSTVTTEQYCVYHIRSLSPGKIRLRLDSINTLKRSICSLTSVFEVKYQSDLALAGARWCGNTITSPWLNVIAVSNTMVVIFRANNSIDITNGNPQASFRATIFFDAEPTPVINQTVIISTISTTTSTTISSTTTSSVNSLTTTGTSSSTCPPLSYRCQSTCGGCLSYQPCLLQAIQQCTAYTYQIQLTGCDIIINGLAQCQYRFVQIAYVTACQRTVLACCPSYQIILFQTHYYCVYNSQATNLPSEWSLLL